MLYIGVDPGRSGAVAIISTLMQFEACRLGDREHVESVTLPWVRQVTAGRECFACLEDIGVIFGVDKGSNCKLFESKGWCSMLLAACGIPYMLVEPKEWQSQLGCLTRGNKNVTKELAQKLLPHMKDQVYHWNADAYLLAAYCKMVNEAE